MTDKPTGVFVRLPLSEDQLKNVDRLAQEISENNSENEWRFRRHYVAACEELIAAIGTPVTGGELEPLAFVNADRLKWKIATNNDVCLTFSGKPHLGGGTLNLIDGIVLHSDALALLAARDAEIARLREENEQLKRVAYDGRGSLTRTIHSPARFADAPLEGGAA